MHLKKWLLSLLTATALLLSLLPGAAWAAQQQPGVDLSKATSNQGVSPKYGNQWFWENSSQTLYLRNVTTDAVTGDYMFILPANCTVVAVGDCRIMGGAKATVKALGNVNLVLADVGTLTIEGLGWYQESGTLTISGMTEGTMYVHYAGNKAHETKGAAIYGNVTVKNTNLVVDGGEAPSFCSRYGILGGEVRVEGGGTLTAKGGVSTDQHSIAIFGRVNIGDGSSITATGRRGDLSCGIYGRLHAWNGASVSAYGGTARDRSFGMFASDLVEIDSSTFKAAGGSADGGSSTGLFLKDTRLAVNGGEVNAQGMGGKQGYGLSGAGETSVTVQDGLFSAYGDTNASKLELTPDTLQITGGSEPEALTEGYRFGADGYEKDGAAALYLSAAPQAKGDAGDTNVGGSSGAGNEAEDGETGGETVGAADDATGGENHDSGTENPPTGDPAGSAAVLLAGSGAALAGLLLLRRRKAAGQ